MKIGKTPKRMGGPSAAFLARKAEQDAILEGRPPSDGGVKVYLDDERALPQGWTLARSPAAFFEMVGGDRDVSDRITHISLDWHLGTGVADGETVARRLAECFTTDPGFMPRLRAIGFHSSDRKRAVAMHRMIDDALSEDRREEIDMSLGTPRR